MSDLAIKSEAFANHFSGSSNALEEQSRAFAATSYLSDATLINLNDESRQVEATIPMESDSPALRIVAIKAPRSTKNGGRSSRDVGNWAGMLQKAVPKGPKLIIF